MNLIKGALIATTFLATTVAAQAQTFSGSGEPATAPTFAGLSEVATFSVPDQNVVTYTEGGVTFGRGRISSQYANQYNSTGSYFDNEAGALNTISFAFANPTSAFAFNWGAADNDWIVNLFSGETAIGTYNLAPTGGSNGKEYFGFSGVNITNATLTNTSDYDWVFIDNFTFGASSVAAVPEPTTWAMMLFGFAFVGFAMRKKAKPEMRVRFA